MKVLLNENDKKLIATYEEELNNKLYIMQTLIGEAMAARLEKMARGKGIAIDTENWHYDPNLGAFVKVNEKNNKKEKK